jgi:ComF family protein
MKNSWLERLERIVDFFLPKEDRVRFLERLGPDGLFTHIPRAENFDFPTNKIRAIFNYKTTLCRQAIWEIKYRANRKLIRDFSLLLYEYILEELTDLETFANFKNITLLPIPASPARNREKGFNQCVLICRELIRIDRDRKQNNFALLENFLIKKNDTVHQARVSNRRARLKNLVNTFSINQNIEVKPDSSYLIIDDVITTGATMTEAFRALTTAGIPPKKIRGFALAH